MTAACRFFDIAFGDPLRRVKRLFEKYDGGDDFIENNAIVWCHMYNCLGTVIQLAGGGINNNYFGFIDADKGSILVATYTNISGNKFENIEVAGINVAVAGGYSGTADGNSFKPNRDPANPGVCGQLRKLTTGSIAVLRLQRPRFRHGSKPLPCLPTNL